MRDDSLNKTFISQDLVLFTDQNIGGGAYGVVFRGEFIGQPCAVKVLHAIASELQTQLPTASSVSEDTFTRFYHECEILFAI